MQTSIQQFVLLMNWTNVWYGFGTSAGVFLLHVSFHVCGVCIHFLLCTSLREDLQEECNETYQVTLLLLGSVVLRCFRTGEKIDY